MLGLILHSLSNDKLVSFLFCNEFKDNNFSGNPETPQVNDEYAPVPHSICSKVVVEMLQE